MNCQYQGNYRADACSHVTRKVVEEVIEKPLPPFAEIYHVDGDPTNNTPSNLVACEDHTYHMLLHRRTDALIACGHANWRRCSFCGKYDSPENLYINSDNRLCWHRKCYNKYQKEYKFKKT